MHRKSRVPKSLLVIGLLGLAAVGGFGGLRAAPQEKTLAVTVPVNGSLVLEMSKKQRIKDIDNKDQGVARVEFVPGSDFRKVMIVGGNIAGLSKLVLTDVDGGKEAFDIVVELNVEFLKRVLAKAAPTANIQIEQGTGGALILTGTVALAADIDIVMRTAIAAVGDPARVVNALRIGGVQQVQLDVVIARVARSEGRSMGFSFLGTGNNGLLLSTTGVPLGADVVTNPTGTAANLVASIITTNTAFRGFLECLRTENLVKIIAQPRLVALSGQAATFTSGGDQAVPTLASGGGGGQVSGIQFVPFGTTVRYLPLVLGGGKIYIEVEPEFSFPDPNPLFAASTGPGAQTFGRTTQRVHTSAVLEDGQTLAIGGLIFHSVNGKTSKVPVLGDLPFCGALFSRVNYTDSEEELLILITPRLVDPMACNQLPHQLPGEETRSPDDFELFLERILEAPRGPREVWQCDKYVPAYKNSPTAGMYPCTNWDGTRGACDLGLSMLPQCGDAGCVTGPLTRPMVIQQPTTTVRPMAPSPAAAAAPLPPMQPRPQLLPEIQAQFNSPASVPVVEKPPVETVPITTVPVESVPMILPPGAAPPAAHSGGSSGVTLARPTPLGSN